MTWMRSVVVAAVVSVTALAVSACSGTTTSSVAVPADPVLAEGQQLYNANCASCHGRSGGGGLGPKLSGGVVVANYPDIADQEAVIANGRGSMPAFGKRFTGEQITAVVRYTRESL